MSQIEKAKKISNLVNQIDPNNIEKICKKNKSCTRCDIKEHVIQSVCGDGNEDTDFMVIARNPGYHEDRIGKPLVGRSGKVYDKILVNIGLERDKIYTTNIVKCFTPDNREPTNQEIQNCIGYLQNEIDIIKPKVIVTMGAVATFALIKEKAITKVRGNVYNYKDSYVIPTVHPAYVLRNPKQINNIIDDFRTAKRLLDLDEEKEIKKNYLMTDDWRNAISMLNNLDDIFSCDIETSGKSFIDDKILGIGFSDKTHSGFFIPMKIITETEDVQNKLKEVLMDENKICVGHGFKFDKNFIKTTFGFEVTNFRYDTMLMGHLLDVNARKNLEFMSRIFPDMAGYSNELKNYLTKKDLDKGSMEKVPLSILTKYCCGDCEAIFRLFPILYSKLEDLGLLDFYEDTIHPSQELLRKMEYEGNNIDFKSLKKLEKEYKKEIKDSENIIYAIAGKEFNLRSTKQLTKVLFNDLDIEPVKYTEKTSSPSTDNESLKTLSLKGYEIADEVLKYRKLQKINSTYVEGMNKYIHNDEKIHCSYNLHIARTMRLSSQSPNLQNIPADDKIRNLYLPPEGHKFLKGDFKQLELKILAFESKDPIMLDIYQNKKDIHSETGKDIFGKDEMTSRERTRAKEINFGMVYGIGPQGLMKSINDSIFEMGEDDFITEIECVNIIRNWFKKYRGVKYWIERVKRKALREGKVTTIFGTFRELIKLYSTDEKEKKEALREAVNTIIQSEAAIYVNKSLVKISNDLKEAGLSDDIKMTLPVHDEIAFILPDRLCKGELFDEIKEFISYNMTHGVSPEIEEIVPFEIEFELMNKWSK